MNKCLKYFAVAAIALAAGCSKEESAARKAPEKDVEVPATFTEAREKGMLDVKWRAELEKARKETSKDVIKINAELAAAEKRLADAKAKKAGEAEIGNLELEVKELKDKAEKAETKRRRAVMGMVKRKMMEDFAAAEAAEKSRKNAK